MRHKLGSSNMMLQRLSSIRDNRVVTRSSVMQLRRELRGSMGLWSVRHNPLIMVRGQICSTIVGIVGISILFILEIFWSSMFVCLRSLSPISRIPMDG